MIFLTGDTHIPIDTGKLNSKNFPEQKELNHDDYVIVLGDFGLLWKRDKEYEYWKTWFNTRNFTTLWIDGNHENHDWIDSLPVEVWNGGKVHRIDENIIHLMRGQVFEIEGKTFFTMGGATSVDKEYRKEGISWWKREEPSYEELEEAMINLDIAGNKVDYILTHTCPKAAVTPMFRLSSYVHSGVENFLNEVYERVTFKEWYFGHWHERKDYGRLHCIFNSVVRLD